MPTIGMCTQLRASGRRAWFEGRECKAHPEGDALLMAVYRNIIFGTDFRDAGRRGSGGGLKEIGDERTCEREREQT